MTSGRFDGAAAVVTGAAGGIGLAIATRLAAEGAAVLLNDLDEERLKNAVTEINRAAVVACEASTGDVADPRYARELVSLAASHFGGLHIFVNNAAVTLPGRATDLSLDDWNRTLAVNLTAPFVLSVEAAEAMRGQGTSGRIINIASIAGKRMSIHAGPAYTASKGGLLALTRHLAFEYAPDGITVNAVCPGGVRSPALESLLRLRGESKRLAQIPIGRFLNPEEIATAVAFLASHEAGGITGVALDVDGGSLIGWEPAEEHRRWSVAGASSTEMEEAPT